ncbi:AI-2E family transporter [Erysipelotrichaceae bacterium HCN-30851]
MKIQHFFDIVHDKSQKLFTPLLLVLIIVVLLKQLQLYDWIQNIYASCLPIGIGVGIAFLFQPLIDRLQQHVSAKISVMIVYIGFAIILGFMFFSLVPIIYYQISDLSAILPKWIEYLEAFLDKHHIAIQDIDQWKQTYFKQGYELVLTSLMSTFESVTSYGIAYITAFFISIDVDFWKRTVKKTLKNVHQFSTFYKTMSTIVYQYLIGTLIDMMFIVISVGIILWIFEFPNALLYAVLMALLNLFPYIGATIGLIIILLIAALSYPTFPFTLAILLWVIQQIEANFIQPMIFHHTMHVRPILTFIFLFISEAVLGIPGIILSPIFAAIAQIGFRSWLHAKTSDQVGKWEDIWQDFDEAIRQEEYK